MQGHSQEGLERAEAACQQMGTELTLGKQGRPAGQILSLTTGPETSYLKAQSLRSISEMFRTLTNVPRSAHLLSDSLVGPEIYHKLDRGPPPTPLL